MTSLPVILCGKDPAVVVPAAKNYLPEVDIVHICHNVETAKAEIPSLLRGEIVVPASGLGSNVDRTPAEQRVPVAAIAGGAFTPEEFEDLMKEKVRSVPWLKVDISNVPPSERPPNPTYPALVVANVKKVLRMHGMMEGSMVGDHRDEIWNC